MKTPFCGMCNSRTVKIQIPPEDMVPHLSYKEPTTQFIEIIGRSNRWSGVQLEALRSAVLNLFHVDLVEVIPVQFGCLKESCGSIATYWFRKDGKPGDLSNAYRQGNGKSKKLLEFPGKLNEII